MLTGCLVQEVRRRIAQRLGKADLEDPDRLAEEAVMSGRHQQLIRSSISSIVASSSRSDPILHSVRSQSKKMPDGTMKGRQFDHIKAAMGNKGRDTTVSTRESANSHRHTFAGVKQSLVSSWQDLDAQLGMFGRS